MKKMDDEKLKKVDGGSTVITIHNQTYARRGEGQHTIAAKFNNSKKSSSTRRTSSNYSTRSRRRR